MRKHSKHTEQPIETQSQCVLHLKAGLSLQQRVIIISILIKAKCVHALKGLALPRASHSGEIALLWRPPALHACGSASPFRASCCQENQNCSKTITL